jgi:hypothetical protein
MWGKAIGEERKRPGRREFLWTSVMAVASAPLVSIAGPRGASVKTPGASAKDLRSDDRARLIGAWRLKEWSEHIATGETRYPLGETATGQLIYSEDGHVAAQLMRAGVPKFAQDDWRKATGAEEGPAWMGYFGYWGSFSIDEEKHAVIHHIEGSWFPNLLGTDQVRVYKIEGQQLILDADTAWGKVHILWEKIG